MWFVMCVLLCCRSVLRIVCLFVNFRYMVFLFILVFVVIVVMFIVLNFWVSISFFVVLRRCLWWLGICGLGMVGLFEVIEYGGEDYVFVIVLYLVFCIGGDD